MRPADLDTHRHCDRAHLRNFWNIQCFTTQNSENYSVLMWNTYRLAMSLPEQSSMSRSQRSPSNPGEQVQRKPSTFHNIINTSFYRSLYCIHAMLFFSKNETLGKILNDLISNYIFVQLTIYVCIYQLFRFSAAVCNPNPVGHILSPPSS